MRPTARGIGLAGAGAALLAAGLGFGYAELTALGAAAVVALLLAVAHAAWRPRLRVTRVVDPDRVARGEPTSVSLTIHNGGKVRAANLVAYDRCGDRTVPVPVLRVRPGHDTTVDYPVPTARRGVVPVGPLRVVRRDPLGLAGAARSHGSTATVWVHPRIHPLTAVPAGAARSLDGIVDRVPHGTITFDSLREYVVGDELRRVHWRTSARVGELMVREQLDTSLPRLVVVLDDRREAHPDPDDVRVGVRGGRVDPHRRDPRGRAGDAAARCRPPGPRRAIPSTGSPRPPWARATCGPPSTGCACTAPATR